MPPERHRKSSRKQPDHLHRTPAAVKAPEFFLTDVIRLRKSTRPAAFMKQGLLVRPWFEERTRWRLALSGRRVDDGKVLNVWQVNHRPGSGLDQIPDGLQQLGTDVQKPTLFGDLLDMVKEENHFITYSIGTRFVPPRAATREGHYFIHAEYWLPYDGLYSYLRDFAVDLDDFAPPWQYVANLRAISGRVNTITQLWLVEDRGGRGPTAVQKQVRADIRKATWNRKRYRQVRVDLLVPTTYDRTVSADPAESVRAAKGRRQ
jgi:hypothetical protein